jgi:hypothetical protein
MATALLLGIPQGYVGTAKSAIRDNASLFTAWSIKYVPSSGKFAEILAPAVKQALQLAEQYEDSHILGFSTQKNRQALVDQIRPYFRFRWFDEDALKCLGSPDPSFFVKTLASDLRQEHDWALRVKPLNLSSPLLLPESSFDCISKHRDLWRHASAYGDPNNIVGAEKAIDEFRNAYHRKVTFETFSKYAWVDDQARLYGRDGPRHGIAPFPRGWKYSYRIEPGFHFDVTQLEGRKFFVLDSSGKRHHAVANAHLNIDPHGHVRG